MVACAWKEADVSTEECRDRWDRARSIVLLLLVIASPLAVAALRHRGTDVVEPVDLVFSDAGWADENRCIECHEDKVAEFQLTGHARTLSRADSEASLQRLLSANDSPVVQAADVRVDVDGDKVRAIHDADGGERSVELDWCFGSGTHARTWVGTLTDSRGKLDLAELRWTWYRSIEDFAVTPGQPEAAPPGYFSHLGLLHDHPKAVRCFGCHSSHLPIENGHFDPDQIVMGVTCQRCHGPRQKHVDSEGEFHDELWQDATPEEAVRRCAQCHRSAIEQEPEDVRPDNPDIARFAPVGLVQSRCFTESGSLTCTTCHDPHRPMSAQDLQGIWQCQQCHSPEDDSHTLCAAGHQDDCLSCHMPKVAESPFLSFTDHWIRTREASVEADR